MTAQEIVTATVHALDSKKAKEIVVLNVGALTALGEHFVVASGGSSTQVKALAGEVQAKLKERGLPPRRVEQGGHSADWVLLDYGEVIVHIFFEETRHFYELERLWADAPRQDVTTILATTKG